MTQISKQAPKIDASNFLSLEGINKSFGNLHVLKDISFSMNKGQKLVICGPSGSGKSTLIRCVNYLEQFESGTLYFDGHVLEAQNASPSKVRALRKEIGMVFQQFNLFSHLTVLNNLILAPMEVLNLSRNEATERAQFFLKRVDMLEKEEAYPSELSGGQQQRIAIARTLCMKPKLVLFDEPTSSLDPEMVGDVLGVMMELADEGMSMVCVTHEMHFAKQFADTMLFLEDGHLIHQSSVDDFFSPNAPLRVREFLSKLDA